MVGLDSGNDRSQFVFQSLYVELRGVPRSNPHSVNGAVDLYPLMLGRDTGISSDA